MHASTLIDFPSAGHAREQLAFGAPVEVLVAHAPADVRRVLDDVQRHAEAGRWCVGWLRYEAAAAFDPAFAVRTADGPLAWFGVHETTVGAADLAAEPPALDWRCALDRAGFDAAVARIVRAIADGEAYQVNFTAPLHAPFAGNSRALFAALLRAQPGGYAVFIDSGDEQVLSVSPELFFDWRGGTLLARPMKGTAPRGATPAQDAAHAAALRGSAKERAENLMIVDLIRNDLSRVAQPRSVQVPSLFDVQPLPSVWQMTSDVCARTRDGTTLAQVFGALFPCGSVTGAPKVAAMRLIRALEAAPRGVYCGAVGLVRPGGAATFNVPIRTVSVRAGVAHCGIGSGIVADSTAEGEWDEWRAKRAFVERASRPFELLETLRLENGRHPNAPAHLERLARAALHFGFALRRGDAEDVLKALEASHPTGRWRTRLRVDASGRVHADASPFEATSVPLVVQLAGAPIEPPADDFVRFKTTRREHYDALAPVDAGVFDTLLWNRRRELTEFTRGNVALRLDGRWLTPALECGLLDGVGRAQALREGRLAEAVLTLDDLARADGMAFLNSLRGWLPVSLR
jgi:para-aminobenzoate synthetase/4-amino-4-deoxychorismate lyase